MPDSYPDYPSRQMILKYLKDFAEKYELKPHIQFNSSVKSARKYATRWEVELSSGETSNFTHLVCANGVNWDPRMPEFKGQFDGKIIHFRSYFDATPYKNKRVLVIGGGNSASDIINDLSGNTSKLDISLRRGYYFLPKHTFGIPTDAFFGNKSRPPAWTGNLVLKTLSRIYAGSHKRLNLPSPDHQPLQSHPLIGTQLAYNIQHGRVTPRTGIERLEGKEVFFNNGEYESYDHIICATGYNFPIPYLDPKVFTWKKGRPHRSLAAFHSERDDLFLIGFLETSGAAFPIVDLMSSAVAHYIATPFDQHLSSQDKFRRLVSELGKNLTPGTKPITSSRHEGYADYVTLLKRFRKLHRKMGWMLDF